MQGQNVTTGRTSKRSMAVAAFSTVVEWYDFTLYLYLATVLSRVFFGDGGSSLSATLASFALAYLVRPLGAAVFGHLGDRYGRRWMMLLSMALITGAMLATTLLPTYAQVGASAGWLLLLTRCLMGFSVGGEYNAVVAYLLEGAGPRRRGLVTSMAAAASEVGGLLAVGVSAITVNTLSPAALDAWGWRLPFAFGAVLAAGLWVARSTLQESPAYQQQQVQGTVPDNPLGEMLRSYRPAVARGFAISALGSTTYYVGITYVPAFLIATQVMAEGEALWLSTAAAALAIVATPLAGILSDRFGRRPVLVALCLGAVVLPLFTFAAMAQGSRLTAFVGALVLAALGGGLSAVGTVATAEQLPGAGRLSGLALGATAATAVFGGATPWCSHALLDWTGSPMAPGALIACVALGVLPVLATLPETLPRLVAAQVLSRRVAGEPAS